MDCNCIDMFNKVTYISWYIGETAGDDIRLGTAKLPITRIMIKCHG